MRKVTGGSELVNQSGDTLDKILQSIRQVTDIVGDISSATKEQASGIEQVNKEMTDMDAMTQQIAAMFEEVAAATETMSEKSRELKELVNFFKIDVGDASADDGEFVGVERRSAKRPWSDSEAKQVNSSRSQKVVGSDIQEDEWEEF